ncbi:hypothetical protein [Mycobacterium sp. MUNTM1]
MALIAREMGCMGGFAIIPANVLAGAERIGAENGVLTGISVPGATAAMAGLPGFATAATLADAHDRVQASLKAVGGRYENMAQICRGCTKRFQLADLIMPGQMSLPSMLSDGFGGMGDLNRVVVVW